MQRFATHTRSERAALPGYQEAVEESPFSAHQLGMTVWNMLMFVPSSGTTSRLSGTERLAQEAHQ